MRGAFVALVLLLALPMALGHPGDESETIFATKGDVTIYVTPGTPVVKAQRHVPFLFEAYTMASGRHLPMTNASWTFDLIGPANASRESQLVEGALEARAYFGAAGDWALLIGVNATALEIPLRVYAPTSVRANWTDLAYGLAYAGRVTRTNVSFVEDATGSVVEKDANVTVRVERLENETVADEWIVPLRPGGSSGEFLFEHTFPAKGAYRASVASPEHGIAWGDLPPFTITVLPEEAHRPAEDARKAPLSAVLVLVGIAVAAFARTR